MSLINMSHTGKNAVHVLTMCGKPEKNNPGVQVIVSEKMRKTRNTQPWCLGK